MNGLWNGLSLALQLYPRIVSNSFYAHSKTFLFGRTGIGYAPGSHLEGARGQSGRGPPSSFAMYLGPLQRLGTIFSLNFPNFWDYFGQKVVSEIRKCWYRRAPTFLHVCSLNILNLGDN